MNKKPLIIVSIVVALFLAGGSIFAYTNSQNNKKEAENVAMLDKQAAAMEKEKMAKEGDAMAKEDTMKKDDAMSKQGSYVTLAEYNKDPGKYADSKKVYFFHAGWCSICQGIEKEINTDMSKIPAGVTLIKTDFDSSTDLRKKYGVTTQYTFVQVDNNGNETAQWSASSLSDAVAGVKL